MKLKKISALLLTLCLLLSCMPQMMASAANTEEATWIEIEAESGDYPSIYRKASNTLTSGGEYIEISNDNCSDTTDATVDWSFDVDVAGKYDVWVLMSSFAGRTSVSQPAWGIDASASTSNAGAEMTGAVYNFAYTATHGAGYKMDFVWVKVFSGKELSADTHTIQYIPQRATFRTDIYRLLAGLDVIRVVPSKWGWTADATLADPAPLEWFDVQAEDGALSDKCYVEANSSASAGKFVTFGNNAGTSADEVQTVTMTFEVPKSGIYDMWTVAGRGNTNGVTEWTFTLDGNTYIQPEQCAIYPLYHKNIIGWNQEMHWSRPGTGISLEAGKEYTIVASVTPRVASAADLVYMQGLDVVRFVPTSWYWGGTDNVNPPVANIVSPDRDGVIELEAEDGIISNCQIFDNDNAHDGAFIARVFSSSSLASTVMSPTKSGSVLSAFNVEKSGKYDIWAAVATLAGTPGYIGGYTFTMDGTDVVYSKGFGDGIDNTNPDLYGETFILHGQAAEASTATVRWVKLSEDKVITSGTHTLLSEISNPSSNMTGLIDCIYVVPSEYNWAAGDSFLVDKGFMLRDESFAWVEGEDFIPANADAELVSVGIAGGTPSGGKELYRAAYKTADANFAPSFTFDVYVDKAGSYSLWNYGYMYSTDAGMHFGYMTASANGTSTSGAADWQLVTTDPGTDEQTKRWNRLRNSLTLNEGKNTITVTYTYGGMNNLFCTDAVAIIPAGWDWTPENLNAYETAPKLDVKSARIRLAAQTEGAITSDLTLVDRGAAGSTITYTSTNSAISNLGKVTIPAGWYGGDARGTITATATKDELSATSDSVSTVVYAIRPIEYNNITFEGDFSAGSTVTAKVTGVKAATEADDMTANAVIAVYKNGEIDSVSLSGEKTITDAAQDITATTTLPDDMTDVIVKGFLWTGLDTIIPISDTIAYGADEAGYDEDLLPLLKAKYEAKNISGFNLGVIADVQSPALDGYTAYNHHYNSLVKASKLIELDAVADLGDMIMGTSGDKEATLGLLAKQSAILAKTNLPVFRVRGNHDDNRWAAVSSGDGSVVIDPDEWTEACSVDWATVMDGTTAGTEAYYYKDFDDHKIRIIALDGVDIPYEYQGETSVGYTFGFTQAQLEWLANEALDFSDKADKDEWGVVILTHVLAYDYDNTVINFAGFGNIMQAFMAGTSGTYSNANAKAPVDNLAYDFTSQGEMEVICMFNGHTHIDGEGSMWGMKYITTGSSLPDECDSLPNRDLYTKNEDLWDIMTIDRANRKIYATRFGAGVDREFTY